MKSIRLAILALIMLAPFASAVSTNSKIGVLDTVMVLSESNAGKQYARKSEAVSYTHLQATWSLTTMTLESLWKMVVGLVSVKNLSGPITIAKVAGASLESGLENFLYFLAMLSVSLGVLNLLPIPVLDGGHLLFYLVEMVRGKPLSEKIQTMGLKVGVTLVVGVMMLAMYNDLSRLFQ